MAPDVHLEEPLLRVHEALGLHQVGGRVAVELRDAGVVADHRDVGVEPGQGQLALGLGEGLPHQDRATDQGQHQQHHQPGGDVRRRPVPVAGDRGTARSSPARSGSSGASVPLAPGAGAGSGEVMVWSLCRTIGSRRGGVPASLPALRTTDATPSLPRIHDCAHLPVRLHRVRSRLRAVPELHRRRADRVPPVPGPAAQAVQRRRRGLQGLGLLPQRQPRPTASTASNGASSTSEGSSSGSGDAANGSSSSPAKETAGSTKESAGSGSSGLGVVDLHRLRQLTLGPAGPVEERPAGPRILLRSAHGHPRRPAPVRVPRRPARPAARPAATAPAARGALRRRGRRDRAPRDHGATARHDDRARGGPGPAGRLGGRLRRRGPGRVHPGLGAGRARSATRSAVRSRRRCDGASR